MREGDTNPSCKQAVSSALVLISHCSIDAVSLYSTYRKPFDLIFKRAKIVNGRGGGIRTPDPLLPKQMRYQTALRPDEGWLLQGAQLLERRFPNPLYRDSETCWIGGE